MTLKATVFFALALAGVSQAGSTITEKIEATIRGRGLIMVRIDGTFHPVFLADVELPWPNQDLHGVAKNWLNDELRKAGDVRMKLSDPDRYGNVYAQVYAGKRWINKEIVEAGAPINTLRSRHLGSFREGPLPLGLDVFSCEVPMLIYRIEVLTATAKE